MQRCRSIVMNMILSILLGALAFFCRFGFSLSLLDPRNYRWLLSGDMAQSFVGWLFFYKQPWQLPWSSLPTYAPALSVSIALTDSQPWFAFLMKLLLPKVEDPLQISGLWFLLCFVLQAFFARAISQKVLKGHFEQVLLCLLLSFSPILFYRVGHASLCAHWLILAAFNMVLAQEYSYLTLGKWWLLLFIASLTHPYFLPMLSSFLLFYYVKEPSTQPTWAWQIMTLRFARVILACTGALAGLSLLNLASGIDRRGIPNFFTADVFAFFNPLSFSALVPNLWRPRMGQYEGYSYLGLGVIVILLACLYLLSKRRELLLKIWHRNPAWQALSYASGSLMLLAWGSDVRFFGQWVINLRPIYELLAPLMASFRSIGRFNWSMCYYITIVSFVLTAQLLPKTWARVGLCLAVLLQAYDLSPYFRSQAWPPINLPILDSVAWQTLARDKPEIIVYPPFVIPDLPGYEVPDKVNYIPLAIFAAEHGLILHSGAFAAASEHLLSSYLDRAHENFKQGRWQSHSIYVVSSAYAEEAKQKGLSCAEMDGYQVCLAKKL